MFRARRMRPAPRWLRHPRGVRFADRPDLSGDGHREPHAPHQFDWARGAGRSEYRQGPGHLVRRCGQSPDVRGEGEGRYSGGVHVGECQVVIAVEIAAISQRHRQFERARRPQLLRARDGTGRYGNGQGAGWRGPDAGRRQARRLLHPALPQSAGQAAGLHPRLRLRGRLRLLDLPGRRVGYAGLRRAVQEIGARPRGRVHWPGWLRGSARALREPGRPRSRSEGRLGDPGAALQLSVQ